MMTVEIQDEGLEKKLLSISQDVVSLASKGKTTTPKQIALAMTVRHFTGSAKVIELLNGLGHSVSNSFVLEHDTALANKQLERKRLTPEGFKTKIPATLIFDNSDFKEETLSGKWTTHCTSGIIVQRHEPHGDDIPPAAQPSHRTKVAKPRCSSIPTPHVEQPVYIQPKRTGPDPAEQPVDTSRDIWQDVIVSTYLFFLIILL